MASKSIFACIILMMLLCLFLMRDPSGSVLKQIQSRKVFEFDAFKDKRTSSKVNKNDDETEKQVSLDELRKVPSGPDPLHHNGGGPKKPIAP